MDGDQLPYPLDRTSCLPDQQTGRVVPADNFCQTLQVNVDNERLSDKDFRQLVRNTLPIVQFPAPPYHSGGSEGPGA